MQTIADTFQDLNSHFLKNLGLTAKFVEPEDFDDNYLIEFVNKNGEVSVVSVHLDGPDTLQGSCVNLVHVETRNLEDGWIFKEVTAVEELNTSNSTATNILNALTKYGLEFEPTSRLADKTMTHPLFIEAYDRVKAISSDAVIIPLHTNTGLEGFNITFDSGKTLQISVDKGTFNLTELETGNTTSYDNSRHNGLDKLATELENFINAASISDSLSQLSEAIEKYVPSENLKWSHSVELGTYIEKYAMGIDPNDGEVTIVRGWKHLNNKPTLSVDLCIPFDEFADEVNDDLFPHRAFSDKMENELRSALKNQSFEVLWASSFENDATFIARTIKLNREEHVIAGTIDYSGSTTKVEIHLDTPTNSLRPDYSPKPRF
jgi:hypothetical protein